MFRIIVPLDETFSFDINNGSDTKRGTKRGTNPGTKRGTKRGTNPDANSGIKQEIEDGNSETLQADTNSKKIRSDSMKDEFLEKYTKSTIACIQDNPSITQVELRDKLQISLRSVKRIIKILQESGRITRKGSNRKGYWKIL